MVAVVVEDLATAVEDSVVVEEEKLEAAIKVGVRMEWVAAEKKAVVVPQFHMCEFRSTRAVVEVYHKRLYTHYSRNL